MTTDLLEDFKPEAAVADGTILDFQTDVGVMSKALMAVQSVVPSRAASAPSLTNFGMRVGEEAQVTGTNSVLHAVSRFKPLYVKTQGFCLLPAVRLLSIVQEAPEADCHIRVVRKGGKETASITSGSAAWTIPLMAPGNFPNLSHMEKAEFVEFDPTAFVTALGRVKKSASWDAMRPYLMLVDVANGRMRASDSIRFQQVKYQFPFACQIPVQALAEISFRAAGAKKAEIAQTPNALVFRFDSTLFASQKVVAKFPDVDEIVLKPTLGNDQDLVVNRAQLTYALKRVRVTADESTSAVVLSLNKGSLTVECKDQKGGISIETVEADWDYPPRHVSFNYRHLLDLLASYGEPTCRFRLGKDLKSRPSPLLLEGEQGFVAVLSQLRLDWL